MSRRPAGLPAGRPSARIRDNLVTLKLSCNSVGRSVTFIRQEIAGVWMPGLLSGRSTAKMRKASCLTCCHVKCVQAVDRPARRPAGCEDAKKNFSDRELVEYASRPTLLSQLVLSSSPSALKTCNVLLSGGFGGPLPEANFPRLAGRNLRI